MFKMAEIGRAAAGLALMVCATGSAAATVGSNQSITPDEALQKLMDGNKRYVEYKSANIGTIDAATRMALAKSQKPYAIILACSDSRVPPELIFDNGLGEIFVVRVAGNIPDPVILGSIEYAAEHLGSPLIMVLGHERCGAVTATVNAKGKPEGNIGAIVKTIAPAVKVAEREFSACKGDAKCREAKKEEFVECAINSNAKLVKTALTERSPVIRHLTEKGKLKIVAAKYDLDDGIVSLLK